MTTPQLKEVFQARYDSTKWRKLVAELFPNSDFYKKPIDKRDANLGKHKDVKAIREYGLIDLQDKTKIVFYEVELIKGNSVTRNRVGLRNILHREVVPGDVDAVIATYYSEGTRDWRVSLISKSLYWDEENNEIKLETSPKRYTYVLGETESVTTAVSRFTWLFDQLQIESKLTDIVKAFSVEKISREFFSGYRHHFELFEAYLIDHGTYFKYFLKLAREGTADEKKKEAERLVRNFVKKLMGRIVFLYFLQKKGWLGVPQDKGWGEGERDFMANLFERFREDTEFYSRALVPLFFETLNSERKGDLFGVTKTKVPYLNGGLFDKDDIEPTDVKFDPQIFAELFEFFNRFNFTIDENSPEDQDIGIDPEMLGLIFENLLEDNQNRGTFYTPKEVVHFMCKESLSQYIATKLKGKVTEKELSIIDDFVKFNDIGLPPEVQKYAADIDNAITEVKICDPAIGSGAFPMGLVYEILRIKKELFGFLKRPLFDYREEKLNIIRNSIYGVDVDKGAVDVARLRFWLSLVVDEEKPMPLPNLDYRIMQGDSLVESFESVKLDYVVSRKEDQNPKHPGGGQTRLFGNLPTVAEPQLEYSSEEKAELNKWVTEYFEPHDYRTKKKIHDKIQNIIHMNIVRIFEAEEHRLESEISKNNGLISGLRVVQTDTPAKKRQKTKSVEKLVAEVKRLENEKSTLKQKLRRLDDVSHNEEKPYFLWHLFFRDVFTGIQPGFDIVIANPPYGVKVDKTLQEEYGLGSRDSYGVFTSMALKKLVKPGGVLCFIVSDTWLTISSHFPLRQQILDNYQLRNVIRLHQDCFRATVNSCIFTVQKAAPKQGNTINRVLAADLTNLSTRKNIPEFRDKIFHLRQYAGQSTSEFAVYEYEQDLLKVTKCQPVIVGSPRLFWLMDEYNCEKDKRAFGEGANKKDVEIRKMKFNDNVVELVKFGDIAEVNQGISTGQNGYYVRRFEEGEGYEKLNHNLLLSEGEIQTLDKSEQVNGVNPRKYAGKKFIPFDKGGESDTDDGWLPNYFVAPKYFIDWSTHSLKRMKTLTIADRKKEESKQNEINKDDEKKLAAALRNQDKWFKTCITFSPTGQYSPTFRLGYGTISQNTSSTIVIDSELRFYTLGLLCSKLARYFFKNFFNHTVHTQEGDVMNFPFLLLKDSQIEVSVRKIIEKQRKSPDYPYFANEQRSIDQRVYELYNLTDDDINEVETWFARRYPKLASYAYIKPKQEMITESVQQNNEERIHAIIAEGESKIVEFKRSLRFDVEGKGVPYKVIEHSSFKNIAAFLNSEGGTLFIGVDDVGKIVGLEETDYTTFTGPNKKDEFLKHFDNLVQEYFGNSFTRKFSIDFQHVKGKTICIIEIKEPASDFVVLHNKEKNKEEFYVRRFASTVSLTLYESINYIKEHWNSL